MDNKHVLLDYKEKERQVAELIEKELGGEIYMVPRVAEPAGISTADYLIRGEKFDLKEPTGSSKNVLYNMVNKKKKQATNFVFDLSKRPLEVDELYKQAEKLFQSDHTSFY